MTQKKKQQNFTIGNLGLAGAIVRLSIKDLITLDIIKGKLPPLTAAAKIGGGSYGVL